MLFWQTSVDGKRRLDGGGIAAESPFFADVFFGSGFVFCGRLAAQAGCRLVWIQGPGS